MRLLAASLILILATGCTVYKSSDRDDFDANGKARAPQTLALTQDDRDLLTNPCAAFNALSDDQIKNLFGPSPRLSMVNELSVKTSTCLITSETNDLSAPSVLACSWKPVSGERIPVTGASTPASERSPEDGVNSSNFAVQTTENELRQNGFDVVTTSVLAGERLRMNCEAYVPTAALIEDRRAGEPASIELAGKFSTFTHDLAVETLPTDVQH